MLQFHCPLNILFYPGLRVEKPTKREFVQNWAEITSMHPVLKIARLMLSVLEPRYVLSLGGNIMNTVLPFMAVFHALIFFTFQNGA